MQTKQFFNSVQSSRLALAIASILLAGCASDMTGVLATDVAAIRRLEQDNGPIPRDLLAQARGIAIFSSTKAGFILGGKGGSGVFLKRLDGGFSPPLAIDLIEGTIGLQVGAETEDAVFVFKTDAAVDRFLKHGRYAVAEAAGSFGNASDRTGHFEFDAKDVTILVHSSGVYGGAVLGGTGFSIDEKLNRETYGQTVTTKQIVNGKVDAPHGTLVLWKLLGQGDSSRLTAVADDG